MIQKNVGLSLIILLAGIIFLGAIPYFSQKEILLNHDKVGIKTIYLIRHAKSSHGDGSLKDFDRPLDEKGNQNALEMGRFLKEKAPKLELMVCSPSKRTQETARLMASQMNFDPNHILLDSVLYGCTVEAYLKVIHGTDDKYNHVAFVSHNPATTSMANLLQKDQNFAEVTTGSVVAIRFKVTSWKDIKEGKGELLFTKDPDDIGKRGD